MRVFGTHTERIEVDIHLIHVLKEVMEQILTRHGMKAGQWINGEGKIIQGGYFDREVAIATDEQRAAYKLVEDLKLELCTLGFM